MDAVCYVAAAMVGDLLYDCWFMSKPRAHTLPFRTRVILSTFYTEIWEIIYSHSHNEGYMGSSLFLVYMKSNFLKIRIYNCMTNIFFILNSHLEKNSKLWKEIMSPLRICIRHRTILIWCQRQLNDLLSFVHQLIVTLLVTGHNNRSFIKNE